MRLPSPDGRIFQVRWLPLLSHRKAERGSCRSNTRRRLSKTRGTSVLRIPEALAQGFACARHSTAIGVRVKDGIVLAVEKLIGSKLLVPGSNKRIGTVDPHAGLVRPALLPYCRFTR